MIRSEKDVTDSELRPYFSTGLGFNFRIHPLAAALANTQFPKMEQNLSSRRRVLLKLSNKMKELKSIKMPEIEGDIVESSFYSFKVLYCPSTVGNLPISIFIEALNAEGVPIFKSITRPLHIEYIFKKDNREFLLRNFQSDAFIIDESDEYPNSEDYFNRALRLPPYFEISDSDIDLIINAFKKVENNIDQLKKGWKNNMKRFEKLTVIVTGGSQGIGKAVSLQFAQEGANVVIADIDIERGKKLEKSIQDSGFIALFVYANVSKEESIQEMVNLSIKHFGSVDILVNCAACFIFKGIEATVDEWTDMFMTNVVGYALCAQYTVPEMIKAGKGQL